MWFYINSAVLQAPYARECSLVQFMTYSCIVLTWHFIPLVNFSARCLSRNNTYHIFSSGGHHSNKIYLLILFQMISDTSFPNTLSIPQGKISLFSLNHIEEKHISRSCSYLENSYCASPSDMTFKSKPSLDCSFKNNSASYRDTVMIDPGYLKRHSNVFSDFINLSSYKFNTLDNSVSKGKTLTPGFLESFNKNEIIESFSAKKQLDNSVSKAKNLSRRYSSPTTGLLKSLHKNEIMDSFGANEEASYDGKKRKATSLNEMYNTYQNPTTRARPYNFNIPSKLLQTSTLNYADSVKPSEYVTEFLRWYGLKYEPLLSESLGYYFDETKIEYYNDYNEKLVTATHSQDIATLRQLQKEGYSLRSCNCLGESLIHMACQRGFADVVKFIVKEGKATLRIRNDYGRTPMHDCCLSPSPNFTLAEFLMEAEPILLFIKDSRGQTPFEYVRREHWDEWVNFLSGKHHLILGAWEDVSMKVKRFPLY